MTIPLIDGSSSGGGGGASDLQEAYDGGNTIDINGITGDPVVIGDATMASAPLQILPSPVPFTGAAGKIYIDTDETIYLYSPSRTKYLSTEIANYLFGLDENADNVMLNLSGNVSSPDNGYIMPRKGTIVYVSAKAGGNLTKSFNILLESSIVATVSLVGGLLASASLDLDFETAHNLQVFATDTGVAATDTVFTLAVKWRPESR